MTTIRLIPQVMEFDVAIDASSMPSLFNQSLETTICEKIDEHVANRIPDAESVAAALETSRDFLRRTRDWVIESMDTDDIARRIGDSIDMSDIVGSMNLNNDTIFNSTGFLRQITEYSRFRSMVNTAVTNIHDSMSITEIIQDKINTMSVNIANDVAEKVMTMLINKISNNDV
jgi:hypothetical protein